MPLGYSLAQVVDWWVLVEPHQVVRPEGGGLAPWVAQGFQ